MKFYGARSCLDYVICRLKEATKVDKWRAYVAETNRIASNNIASIRGGTVLNITFAEYMEKSTKKPDRRSGMDIVRDVAARAGIKVVE